MMNVYKVKPCPTFDLSLCNFNVFDQFVKDIYLNRGGWQAGMIKLRCTPELICTLDPKGKGAVTWSTKDDTIWSSLSSGVVRTVLHQSVEKVDERGGFRVHNDVDVNKGKEDMSALNFFKKLNASGQMHPVDKDGIRVNGDPPTLPPFHPEDKLPQLLETDCGLKRRQHLWNKLRKLKVSEKTQPVLYVTELHLDPDEKLASRELCCLKAHDMEKDDVEKQHKYDLSSLVGSALGMMNTSFKTRKFMPGVNWPLFFLGSQDSVFPMHCEDMDLMSVNLHLGGHKTAWYSIQAKDVAKFENVLKLKYGRQDGDAYCPSVARHKQFFLDEKWLAFYGIVPCVAVQGPWEMIVTFPKGYHQGLNEGFAVNVAVNYATDLWVDFGMRAKFCTCGNNDFRLPMEPFIRQLSPHQYDSWLTGSVTSLPQMPGSCRPDLIGCELHHECSVPTLTELLESKIPCTQAQWIKADAEDIPALKLLKNRIKFLKEKLHEAVGTIDKPGNPAVLQDDAIFPLIQEEYERMMSQSAEVFDDQKMTKRKRQHSKMSSSCSIDEDIIAIPNTVLDLQGEVTKVELRLAERRAEELQKRLKNEDGEIQVVTHY